MEKLKELIKAEYPDLDLEIKIANFKKGTKHAMLITVQESLVDFDFQAAVNMIGIEYVKVESSKF